jgi:hypothetical protein
MKSTNRSVYLKPILLALLIHSSFIAHAQLSASMPYRVNKPDSLTSTLPLNENKEHSVVIAPTAKANIFDDEDDNKLQKTIALNISKSQERKQLMEYLKQLELGNTVAENQKNNKALYRFANLFARLKLYPLAMKCFFKTIQRENKKARQNSEKAADIDAVEPDELPINAKDDSLVNQQAQQVKKAKSKYTSYKRIVSTFNDNKPVVAYALLFHVKQPISGKPKVFVFSNTGHTFITLIKYNADSTYVSCSFGFYPKKEKILFATPWDPSSESEFKNDTGHQWDEVVGKFISKRSFENILKLTKKYNDLEYHLSNNNCTDFCLQAATLAGLNIKNTKAKWPLGYGNNPGVTGQSIMDGTYNNTDQQPDANLFKALNIDPVVK